ncbi:hypothetical protein FRZ06_09925 [Anoxybacterium hadale]|uniref:Uncharacterized protein n=1 Tax=Anoxybacterium hadale TaxID=3408580 RepID=A0ACD1ABT5_9FIRM|nr:hypothetical protein FRZ06_09925 [Clostridiales bacterium]
MDERLKKLTELQRKREEIEIAKKSDRLMAEGGTDSDPAMAQISDNGNVTRQMYQAIGHETLQSEDDGHYREMLEKAKGSLPYHDNQSNNY